MTDLLYPTPGNPVPDNASAGFLTARDGRKIRYARFAPTGRPDNGTVVLLQGRNECTEKYFETISDLSAKGLGVATFDWRGQGGSDRLLRNPQRGYVKSFRDYVADLEQFFEEVVLPDCRGPYYILAHSTGALVALLTASSMVNRVQRMVLLTPFLGIPGQRVSMARIRFITTLLSLLGLGRLYAAWGPRPKQSIPFDRNNVTSDAVRYRRNTAIYETHPELALGGPTIRWLRAASSAAVAVSKPEFTASVRISTLIIAAGADNVVSTKAITSYARHLRLSSLLTVDGARHELLQEADLYREQTLAAFHAFIPGNDDGTL